jgi:hypothetical protein
MTEKIYSIFDWTRNEFIGLMTYRRTSEALKLFRLHLEKSVKESKWAIEDYDLWQLGTLNLKTGEIEKNADCIMQGKDYDKMDEIYKNWKYKEDE